MSPNMQQDNIQPIYQETLSVKGDKTNKAGADTVFESTKKWFERSGMTERFVIKECA